MNNPSLENYKKRRRKRLWPKTVNILIILSIVAIIDVIVKWLHAAVSNRILVIVSSAIIVFTIYLFKTLFFEKLKTKKFFFTGFDFRQPDDDNTIAAAIEGIFSFSKSQPYFIHVTSPNEEINQIFNAFGEGGSNFIHIHGKPGEGKSMLAYHAIYRMEKEGSLSCNYSLNIDALTNKDKDVIEDILNEIDGLPNDYDNQSFKLIDNKHSFKLIGSKPSLKLILIDDAHRLPFSYELEEQLRIEAKQGNGCFIWITTDLDIYDKARKKTGDLSINFQAYYLQLVKTLYESKDIRIQKLMAGKFPKLDLAKAQAKGESEPSAWQKGRRINDPWTFNFVASDGFEKLKEDILKLNQNEKYILYLLSAYTTITGENPLPDSEFYAICNDKDYKPTWFQLSYSEFLKTLRELSEQKPECASNEMRRMMLRLTEDTLKNVSAESLHFLFAASYLREVSLAFPENNRLEMLIAVKALLDNDWKKFRYLYSFLINIGSDTGRFF
ncbi:MAG: hypothetical protein ACXVBZ_15820 [Flavisolibacter sp.]